MEESEGSSNGQQGKEKVINIIVFQEPPGWQKKSENDSCLQEISLKNIKVENIPRLLGSESNIESPSFPSHHSDPVCRPQSFIIDSSIHAASSSIVQVQRPTDYIVKVKDGNNRTVSPALSKDCLQQGFHQSGSTYSLDSNTDLRDLQTGSGSDGKHCMTQNGEEGWANGQKRVKLSSHASHCFFTSSSYVHDQNQSTSTVTNISSATRMTPQVFLPSSSLPFSPVPASSLFNVATTEPVTPTAATTPDSGFYTPSQFEPSSSSHSAVVNPFFTSTPRRSSLTGPQTSTPCLMETPKSIKCEGLQQRFTDMYNAMDWDSLDDSGGMSEDPKEGNDSGEGESSPNSSLRSVQWLKAFSIGDSVKPLLSSPPTPCYKSIDGNCTNPSSINTATSTLTTQTAAFSSPPCLRPLPVIMAPRIPTYLQSQCIVAPSSTSSTSSSPAVSVQGVSTSSTQQSQDVGNNSGESSKKIGQRKALEELKMNKPERNIGRSKYTGKIFTRPGYSYMDLIKMAMQSSEEGEMTLKQIVTWIEDHFPFFKHEAKDSWKSSIRHNLSLHSDFMKADDKKHGCKWKLCDDVVQPNLHVPAPQEMTSVQTAYLKRAKKNIPQPILPKVNAYALVPIHSLTTPVSETAQQQLPTLPPPPLTPMPRKPIHILPKQVDEGVIQSVLVQQEGLELEELSHQQVYQIVSQETPSEQHQVIQQLLQKGPQYDPSVSTLLDDQTIFSTADYISNVPAGIYQSSDSNSNQSFGFPSLRSFDQSLPSTSKFVDVTMDSNSVTHVEVEEPRQALGGYCYTMEHEDSTLSSGHPFQTLPSSQNKSHQGFPLNPVVEVRQEEGANPGEKKIVFVLQDIESGKRLKKSEKVERCGSSRKSSKNLSEIFEQQQESVIAQSTSAVKSFCFGGKKRSKEVQRGNRQHRGPVLNLQSVLQNSLEDKKASDTIGLLLQEEDEGKRLVCTEGSGTGSTGGGFTRVKNISESESHLHFNSHMQRALQEQTANIMSQVSCEGNAYETSNEVGDSNGDCSLERLQCRTQLLPRAGSRLLPFPTGKRSVLSLRDRMGMVKGKNALSSDGFEDVASNLVDNLDSKAVSSHDLFTSQCTTRSASQLVFHRLPSCDQSSDSLLSNSSYSATCLSDKASRVVGNCDRGTGAASCGRKGNNLRSKSRRKQVHVPLTIEISPVRRKTHSDSDEEDSPVIVVDEENAQYIDISGEKESENSHTTLKAAPLPVSLCTNIQQPSLKILQEKPLEQYQHVSQTGPIKPNHNYTSEDLSFSDHSFNSSDADKVIENIFICSRSPAKEASLDRNVQLSVGGVTNFSAVDHPSEFDTPPSMLHFLSTFPKDMEFSSQSISSGNENHKARICDDRSKFSYQGHLDTRISSSSNHQSKVSSSSNNFLETPSPPSRLPPTSKSAQKKVFIKDENRSFGLLSLSPVSPCRGNSGAAINLAGSSSSQSWNINNSMYTPPCGTILHSSTSSFSSKSPSRGALPTTGESLRVRSFQHQHNKTMLSHNTEGNDIAPRGQQQIISRPLCSISNNESNDCAEQSLTSVHHLIAPSALLPLSTSTAAVSSSPSSQPLDLTRFAALSYSLTTPPCGNSNVPIDNATTKTASDSNSRSSAGNSTPLFLSVPGSGFSPLILSPTPANSNQQHTHHLQPDPFPSFTPESLGNLDPSIMENLDLFISNLPGLSPGQHNFQLSPHS